MERNFKYEITKQDSGKTIADYLKAHGYSHAVLVHLKKTKESILLNKKWEYMNTKLKSGDVLSVHLIENDGSSNIVPSPLPFPICYEDEDIVIVSKPSNMPIHPSQNNYENTLANAAISYYAKKGIAYTFRCVNRLDRDTTGLTILAKHMLSSAILNTQTAERKIQREYIAIADGHTKPYGTIDAPIGRKDGSTIERIIDFSHGEHAVTHYETLCYHDNLSLVRLHLETGRTHQIRVHMKSIGHPLIGDFLYNPDFSKMSRQALHSEKLTFCHPISGKLLSFCAPLPPDMKKLFPDYTKN